MNFILDIRNNILRRLTRQLYLDFGVASNRNHFRNFFIRTHIHAQNIKACKSKRKRNCLKYKFVVISKCMVFKAMILDKITQEMSPDIEEVKGLSPPIL